MKKISKWVLVFVVFLCVTFSFSQSTITGKVLGSDFNQPLPGANIIEKGTSNGTTTDFDGNFTFTTNADAGELVITFVGFESKTIVFDGSLDFGSIILNLDNTLDEVVIVGTGIIDLAGSRKTPVAVSTIKGREIQLKASGNVEFGEAMKNTPSVYVSNQSGGFGDSQIFLRGFDQTNTAYLLNGQPITRTASKQTFPFANSSRLGQLFTVCY